MKKYRNRLCKILIINALFVFNCFSQLSFVKCASGEIEKLKCLKNKDYAQNRAKFNANLNELIAKNRNSKARGSNITTIIRIPVVVHVIHNNESNFIGGKNNPNITNEQIISQIEVLNEDYRRKPNTLGFNSNPLGTDMEIEFYLANIDPNGKATTGINRIFDSQKDFDPFSDNDQKRMSTLSYWPSDCYLNIWTTSLANQYLGYSQFPSAPNFAGLEEEIDEKLDGVYIDYRYFGRKAIPIVSKYYKLGRTTTHEVGHWLGLIHIWGDENCGDDYVDDTPTAQFSNLTFFCDDKFSNCNGTRSRNMIENYMDYTVDSCMNIFTKGQKARVNAVFELSPRRKKLIECTTKLPESEKLDLQISPNPVEGDVLKAKLLFKGTTDMKVAIFNFRGNLIDEKLFTNKSSFIFSFPLNGLPEGLYIVKAIGQGQSISKRFKK
jgi:predicted Zn-dependent protease